MYIVVWALVLLKSVTSYLASQNTNVDQVTKTKGRNLLLVGMVCLGSFGKLNHELKATKDIQLLPPSANLKLGQFVTSASESEWATQIGDAYDSLKNSSYFNQAVDYTGKAKDYVSEVLTNSTTVQKAVDVKDQMVQKFDKWISNKIDTQKLQYLSKAAKKKFWNEFINEVIDDEFEYQQTPSKQPTL